MRFIWPVEGPVTRDFYYRSSLYVGGQHAAIDQVPEDEQGQFFPTAPIKCIADGVVVGTGWDFYSGFFVAIDHSERENHGWRSTYRHLYTYTAVTVGQLVIQGQHIGNVGNTGWSLGDHLHFDLWVSMKVRDDAAIFYKNGWYAVDPELYLGKEDDMTDEQLETILREMRGHATYTQNLIRSEADRIIKKMDGHHTYTQNLIREVDAGGGQCKALTNEETIAANQQALREGTH